MIRYEFDGQRYAWTGAAENLREAMQKAWETHHA